MSRSQHGLHGFLRISASYIIINGRGDGMISMVEAIEYLSIAHKPSWWQPRTKS